MARETLLTRLGMIGKQGRELNPPFFPKYIKLVKEGKIKCAHPEYDGENDTERTWCAVCHNPDDGNHDRWKINYWRVVKELAKYYLESIFKQS